MGLIDWIFPKECLSCGKGGAYLCFDCKKTLNPHPELCPSCHRLSKGFSLCRACRSEDKMALEGIIVGFSYEKWLKKLILKLKFYHQHSVGEFLSQRAELLVLTHEELARAVDENNLVISWVPSHWWRHYFEKGYNQSQLLAQDLAKRLRLPSFSLAKKRKNTASQLTLKRSERLTNLQGAFVAQNLDKIKKWSLILLVDDVTTTGATLNQLAMEIKKMRPDLKIWWLVLARKIS